MSSSHVIEATLAQTLYNQVSGMVKGEGETRSLGDRGAEVSRLPPMSLTIVWLSATLLAADARGVSGGDSDEIPP